jgi:hypothetical protein
MTQNELYAENNAKMLQLDAKQLKHFALLREDIMQGRSDLTWKQFSVCLSVAIQSQSLT